jgi:LytS/YehU family sensor histidine kinase
MKIHWRTHAIRFSVTWVFCTLIALAQYIFNAPHGFWIPFVYSMLIGTCTVGLIEIGSYALADPSSHDRWPKGWKGVALMVMPLIFGYIAGSKLADLYFGWSSWSDTRVLKTSITVSLIAGIAITYFFHTRSKQQELQAQLKATQLQATEAKLKLLEAQLDPHLLFNTLANLRVLIGLDSARAQTMLDHMIAYLRATLSGSRASTHSLEQEFARLRDYLELMQIRMGERLSFTLDLPPAMKTLAIPALLLQPLVENAIKHGLEPSKNGGTVTVRAAMYGGRVSLEVSDTGLGNDPIQLAEWGQGQNHGYGLGQVRERLLTVYGSSAEMLINTEPGHGTQVILKWPLR